MPRMLVGGAVENKKLKIVKKLPNFFPCINKRAKCHLNGVKMAIFFKNNQNRPATEGSTPTNPHLSNAAKKEFKSTACQKSIF